MSTRRRSSGADYAVVVYREDGRWAADLLPDRLTEDLDGVLAVIRRQSADGVSLGLVNVGNDFFVALRMSGSDVRLLLSDRTAAVAWDLAKEVTDRLDLPVLDDESDVEEVWPAGDLSIFSDLGMDEMELGAVLADLDVDADEMILSIAERIGFADAFERAVDAATVRQPNRRTLP